MLVEVRRVAARALATHGARSRRSRAALRLARALAAARRVAILRAARRAPWRVGSWALASFASAREDGAPRDAKSRELCRGTNLALREAVSRISALVLATVLVACGGDDVLTTSDAAPSDDAESAADAADAATEAAPKPKPDADAPVPDVDSIPWKTGAAVGNGVASKDTENPLGNSMLVAYAGYAVDSRVGGGVGDGALARDPPRPRRPAHLGGAGPGRSIVFAARDR